MEILCTQIGRLNTIKMLIPLKLIYRFKAILIKVPKYFFNTWTRLYIRKDEGIRIAKTIQKKKKKVEESSYCIGRKIMKEKPFLYSQHFLYQTYGCSTPSSSLVLCGYQQSVLQFNSIFDINQLEFPRIKGSVPQEYRTSHFRCQLQAWSIHTFV